MSKRINFKLATLSLAMAACLYVPAASAVGNDVIEEIQIRGLNRVSKGAVLLALPIKEGDVITSENTAQTMQSLYATGDFDDVKLSRNGNVFIVTVKERPTIGSVDYSGNQNINKEQLEKIIDQQGIKVGEPLNAQTLSQIQKSLEDFYHSSGMYQATVNAVVTDLPRNRANIKIEITEGKAAEIEQINIVGNKAFDEEVLLAQMQLRDDVPWWNFMANQRFSGQNLRADLESLKTFYMDRGYVDFKVNSTSVELTPDKKGIYLTIAINEGEQYKIKSTSIRGDTLKYGQELRDAVTIQPEQIYNQRLITENEKTLTSILGKYGYANSEVKAFPIYNDDKTVDVEFNVVPGKRIHVSQVLITGNDSTDDVVIRRELRQMDGSWLSSEAVELSKARLNRTGFFEEADITTENVGASGDTVNVNTKVKERATGSISGGVGFGTDSGLTIQAAISQNNLFGWGTRGTISSYENDYRKHMELSYIDPYFTVDNVSLGGRVFYDKYDGDDDDDVTDYSNKTIGAYMQVGYPLSENWSVTYQAGVERSKIKNNGTRFQQSDFFFSMYGKNTYTQEADFTNFKFEVDLTHNSLNKSVFPTEGNKQSFTFNITTPNSDLHYYKATAETAHYFPIDMYHQYVFAVRGKAGYGNGYRDKNGTKEVVPFFDSFYLGGSEWLRGFSRNSIGPRALYLNTLTNSYYESNTSVGGNAFWAATAEFIVPTPLISEAYKNSVRTSVFFDAGALWDTRSKMYIVDYSDPSKYRTSLGIAVVWMSPIGPLSFNYASALKKYSGDDERRFSFNIGSAF